MVRILGIDPAIAILGWGVVDVGPGMVAQGWGIGGSKKGKADNYERLVQVGKDVGELLETWRPTVVVVERFQVHKATESALWVHRAVGVIVFVARLNGYPVVEYAPVEMKTTVTGNYRAEKIDVALAVQTALALSCLPTPDHAADALGLALCHVKRERIGGVA